MWTVFESRFKKSGQRWQGYYVLISLLILIQIFIYLLFSSITLFDFTPVSAKCSLYNVFLIFSLFCFLSYLYFMYCVYLYTTFLL